MLNAILLWTAVIICSYGAITNLKEYATEVGHRRTVALAYGCVCLFFSFWWLFRLINLFS